ncbi:hypothetical protein [Sodaliphilus sp.]|uniref:hypothetical protein n=1 Tax=Sodaliphilus sp. TaxID=2815818 RepID=UPI00388FEFEE
MAGWFAISRDIFRHWIWKNPLHAVRWIELVSMAKFESCSVELGKKNISLERGQFITTTRQLQGKWLTNAKTVLAFLSLLEKNKMIICKKSKEITLISIVNFDKYQPQILNEILSENEDQGKREGKHYKKYKNINNINSTHTREKEIEFQERLKGDDMAKEDAMRILHVEESECKELLDMFLTYERLSEDTHSDYPDFRTHFVNWSKKHLSIEKENGNATKQNDGAKNRYDNRRGTEPGNPGSQDYGSDF